MKKWFLAFSIGLLIGSSIAYPQAKNDSLKIGFLMASTFADRWQKDRDYFIKKANKLGARVLFIDCYDVVGNQIDGAQTLVDEKVDGVVILAVDALQSAPAVNILKEAGIPVLAYDRMILYSDLDYYVTYNSVDVGEMMAREVLKKIQGGTILYVSGPPSDYNSKFIREGVFNVLKDAGTAYTVTSIKTEIWNPMDSYMGLQNYLDNGNPMPAAIITAADVLARGIIEVLDENNALGKVIVTGQDAELDICKLIARGSMDMTVYKPSDDLVDIALETIWNAVNHKEVKTNGETYNKLKQVPTYNLKAIEVTRENLDEAIIKDGYYTREQIYTK